MKRTTELYLKMSGFIFVFMILTVATAMLFRMTYQELGFALIICGLSGIYMNWLQHNHFFVGRKRKCKKH